MSVWQPIETAPKNGEWIVGFIPFKGDRTENPYIVMRWCDIILFDDSIDDFEGEWLSVDDSGGWAREEVTHWMPVFPHPDGPGLCLTSDRWPEG